MLPQFKNNILRYKTLELETYLTEIDIGDKDESWNDSKAEKQRQMYSSVIKTAMEAGVEYIHFWGLRDRQDKGWRTDESPLLFDQTYTAKPAYFGVLDALKSENSN